MSRGLAQAAGRAALAGATLGASLTLAEVVSGYLAGGSYGPRWWAFVAAYYVPGCAVLGSALETGLYLVRRVSPRTFEATLRRQLVVAAAVYLPIVFRHEVLAGSAWPASARWLALALVAALGARALHALSGASGPPLPLLPLLLTCSCVVALRVAQLLPAPPAAFLFVLVASLAAAAGLLHLVAGPAASPRFRAVAILAAIAGLAGVAARARESPFDAERRQLSQPGRRPELADKPSIVLIVLDGVRAANLSCYGHARRTTPYLDALARESVLYSRAVSVATWSLPAHASLFTGLMPSRHRADAPRGTAALAPLALDHAFDTLAEILTSHGYATAGVAANFGMLGSVYNLDQGFRDYQAEPSEHLLRLPFPPLLRRVAGKLPAFVVEEPLERTFPAPWLSAEEVVARARTWLVERRPAGQPYFLFLNFMDAHSPYLAEGRRARFPERAIQEIASGQRAASPTELRRLQDLYDGALAYLDRQVGSLIEFLRSLPDWDDTWVFVTSDHGEALGERGELGHYCSIGQEVLAIPLIVRYPRSVPVLPGVDPRPVQPLDVLPTILAGLGLPIPRGLDGVSIGTRRGAMLAEANCSLPIDYLPPSRRGSLWAVLEGDLKYVEATLAPPSLFDLQRDPVEKRNLATLRSGDLERLRMVLERWRRQTAADPPHEGAATDTLRERRESLRALGYLH